MGIAGHYYDVWTLRLWVTGSLRQGLRGQVHVHEGRLLLPAATVCGGQRPVELPLLSREGGELLPAKGPLSTSPRPSHRSQALEPWQLNYRQCVDMSWLEIRLDCIPDALFYPSCRIVQQLTLTRHDPLQSPPISGSRPASLKACAMRLGCGSSDGGSSISASGSSSISASASSSSTGLGSGTLELATTKGWLSGGVLKNYEKLGIDNDN